jgi:hypothetical protein
MDKLYFKDDRRHQRRHTHRHWLTFASLAAISPLIMAQEHPPSPAITPDEQQQRLRTEQQAQGRAARQQAPDIRLSEKAATDFHRTTLPVETPCFTFTQIHLQPARWPVWLRKELYKRMSKRRANSVWWILDRDCRRAVWTGCGSLFKKISTYGDLCILRGFDAAYIFRP